MNLKNIILIKEKPKSKHVMFKLADEYPARFIIEYTVRMKYGKVGDLKITCPSTGRIAYLKPHQVEASIEAAMEDNNYVEVHPHEW
ncbi:hypothetical protein ZZ1p0114 [Acinetobacter phage ZZ1]|jgi:hypothetical protein|uniref:Uncharacterized protein n=3 Tax=Caudoviricetes TaxID=2731619 RepID=A0A410T5S0_9CAUD|nr:hypothetical protein ZZ1p0114 [Acinetobacter phage ZZ1]AFL47481.1 hypothetical protein ZZ1p0114 [Acinetobacter phage ZZ1]QAU03966.1 hypothetical protein Henu6_gp163 [Acinetobacter phage Henu6]